MGEKLIAPVTCTKCAFSTMDAKAAHNHAIKHEQEATMEYTKECGCCIRIDSFDNFYIVYCDTHLAAPELYEACLSALGVMATLDQSKGWVKEISANIDKALAKAEGK